MFCSVIVITLIANALMGGEVKREVLDFDQFDSLCIADTIPRDLSSWDKYVINNNNNMTTVFTIDKSNTTYEVTFAGGGNFNVAKKKNDNRTEQKTD